MVRMKQERYARGPRRALERAAAADPDSPKAHYQLSLAYARLGDDGRVRTQVEIYREKLRAMEARMRSCGRQPASPRRDAAMMRAPLFRLLLAALLASIGADRPFRSVNLPRRHARSRHHLRASRRAGEEIHRRVDERRRGTARLR